METTLRFIINGLDCALQLLAILKKKIFSNLIHGYRCLATTFSKSSGSVFLFLISFVIVAKVYSYITLRYSCNSSS